MERHRFGLLHRRNAGGSQRCAAPPSSIPPLQPPPPPTTSLPAARSQGCSHIGFIRRRVSRCNRGPQPRPAENDVSQFSDAAGVPRSPKAIKINTAAYTMRRRSDFHRSDFLTWLCRILLDWPVRRRSGRSQRECRFLSPHGGRKCSCRLISCSRCNSSSSSSSSRIVL
jgi:hypothetical protein